MTDKTRNIKFISIKQKLKIISSSEKGEKNQDLCKRFISLIIY